MRRDLRRCLVSCEVNFSSRKCVFPSKRKYLEAYQTAPEVIVTIFFRAFSDALMGLI